MDIGATLQDGKQRHIVNSGSRGVKAGVLSKLKFHKKKPLVENPSQPSIPEGVHHPVFSDGNSGAASSGYAHVTSDVGTASTAGSLRKRKEIEEPRRVVSEGGVTKVKAASTPRKRKGIEAVEPSIEAKDGSLEMLEAKPKKKRAVKPKINTVEASDVQPTEKASSSSFMGGLTEVQVTKPKKRVTRSQKLVADDTMEGVKSTKVPGVDEVSQPKEAKPREETAKAKATPSGTVKAVKEPKAKSSIRMKKNNQILAKGDPRWTWAQSQPFIRSEIGIPAARATDDQPEMQPTIWCGSKEELVAALPELSKPVNGITWLLSRTPVIFVEDRNKGILFSDLVGDGTSFEFKMTQDFICLSGDLISPADQHINKSPLRIRGGASRYSPYHTSDGAKGRPRDRSQHDAPTTRAPWGDKQGSSNPGSSSNPNRPFPHRMGQTDKSFQQNSYEHHKPPLWRRAEHKNGHHMPRPFSDSRPSSAHAKYVSYKPNYSGRSQEEQASTSRRPGYQESVPTPGSFSNLAPTPIYPPGNNRYVNGAGQPGLPHVLPYGREHIFSTTYSRPVRPRGFRGRSAGYQHSTPHRHDTRPYPPLGPRKGYYHPQSLASAPGPSGCNLPPKSPSAQPPFSAPTHPRDRSLKGSASAIDGNANPSGSVGMGSSPRSAAGFSAADIPAVDPRGQDYGHPLAEEAQGGSSSTSQPPQAPRQLNGQLRTDSLGSHRSPVSDVAPLSNARSQLPIPPPLQSIIEVDDPMVFGRQQMIDGLTTNNGFTQHQTSWSQSPAPLVPMPPHNARLPPTIAVDASSVLNETQRSVSIHQVRENGPSQHHAPVRGAVPPSNLTIPPQLPIRPHDSLLYGLTALKKLEELTIYEDQVGDKRPNQHAASVWDVPPPANASMAPEQFKPPHDPQSPPTMMEVDVPPTSDETQPGPSLPRSHEYSAPVSFSADDGAEPTLDQRVPCKLPSEVVAICDAYAAGTPVVAIVARSFLSERWGIAVPEECGYAYLGFFKVTSVLERRLVSSNMPKILEPGHVAGRMEWTFRCTWVPSGEDMPPYPDSDSDTESDHPPPPRPLPRAWWAPSTPSHPNPPPTPTAPTSAVPDPDVPPAPPPTRDDHIDDEENVKTNPRYLARRHKHPNHAVLLTSELYEHFYSPLPDYMRAPPGDGLAVGDIPTGWWCAACGRVSFQSMLRHRVCVSSMCEARRWRKAKLKGKAKAVEDEEKREGEGEGEGEDERDGEEGYAVGLWHLRDPAQAAPLSHPGNTYPVEAVDGTVGEWGDGMQTFTYTWVVPVPVQARNAAQGRGRRKAKGGSGGGGVIAAGASGPVGVEEGRVTHVFTGNDRTLQVEADLLLRDLQIQVPLQRKMGSNSPYFSYTVGGPEKGAVPWDEVPECILHARDVMLGRAGLYGEREVEMNVMTVLAWVVTGSRKGVSVLKCAKHPVVLMLLGCEAAVTLIPKAGFPESEVGVVPGLETLLKMKVDGDVDMEGDPIPFKECEEAPLVLGADADDELMDVEPAVPGEPTTVTQEEQEGGVVKGPARKQKREIIVTMVHGDVVVLSGDAFEYSIKRFGTSILLMGSTVEGA